jgi:type VI secretion system secreted protein VgrG
MRAHLSLSLDPTAIIHSASFEEGYGRLYECQIKGETKKPYHSEALGAQASLTLNLSTTPRIISGMISRLEQHNDPSFPDTTLFTLTLRPHLWSASLSKHCRIFQKKSAQEIIQEILKKHNITPIAFDTTRGKEKREYTTQFNESDYAFCLRLMEEEGMTYTFKHTKGKENLFIVDETTSHLQPISKPLRYDQPVYGEVLLNRLLKIEKNQTLIPSVFKTTSYDFEKPQTNLLTRAQGKKSSSYEVYSYEHHFNSKSRGEAIADYEMTRLGWQEELYAVETSHPHMEVGTPFSIEGHPDTSIHGAFYYPIHITHTINTAEPEGDILYTNTALCLPKNVPYLPKRVTHTPYLSGHQTAVVVGPEGEEIHCDELGRIKVQFHWDLEGKKDDESSCWLRVLQPWAGNNWGTFFTPRIGMEVVVSFQQGNPDLPMVLGCVYNGKNKPENASTPTKSGIKTQSSPDKKEGYNEISFEDKAEQEEITIHAEKDLTTRIRANLTEELYEEGNHTYILTKGNRTETFKEGDDERTLEKGNASLTLTEGDLKETLTKGNYSLSLDDGKYEKSIKGAYTSAIEKKEQRTNKDGYVHEVTKKYSLKAKSIDMEAEDSIKMKAKKITLTAQDGVIIKAGKITIQGETGNVVIKADAGNISLNASAGKVEIKGTAGFEAKSDGPAKVSSSAKLDLQATMINLKADAMGNLDLGAMGKVKASGMLDLDGGGLIKIKGGLAMIN